MGYTWLPTGATSVHKTVLIDAVHSGTVCCAGRDPYLNMTVHLVPGGSMSTCTPPPPFEASNTVMNTASIFHRAAVANHAFSCVCGGKEESWSIQNIRTHVHMFTRSQLLASHTLKQNVPSGGTLYYTDQLIILSALLHTACPCPRQIRGEQAC